MQDGRESVVKPVFLLCVQLTCNCKWCCGINNMSCSICLLPQGWFASLLYCTWLLGSSQSVWLYVVWGVQLLHCISFEVNGLNADCVSSAVTSFSLVAGVRSSRCDPLPVGVGHRSAPLLQSSRSLSFTTINWSTNNKNWNILMVECYSISFFYVVFFFHLFNLNLSLIPLQAFLHHFSRCFTFQSWIWIWSSP